MRPVTPAALCLLTTALLSPLPAPAQAAPAPAPACGDADAHGFPLTTRIHGGPDTYAAGGDPGTWYVDVTNTTDRACSGIHPVVVLVDQDRELTPAQPRLEFYEGRRPHPVRFEATDADEIVAPFEAGGFRGFTIGAGRTTRVEVRLSVTSDTVPNDITATAAVVQRQGDDGDWVGESNAYRFRVVGETSRRGETAARPDRDTASAPPSASAAAPETTPSPRTPTTLADELARTGLGSPSQALALAVALVVAGTALLLARRRR
ncbi:LPXTG cell wall anchor domain-containing protein [Streptomyces sp. NPDC004610]|uniref:LPXTG cell wall anchor domain-containing protein n=1 Tax=unclassified Streptomyces TaxID=2593676 RepID=UPI0033A57DD8